MATIYDLKKAVELQDRKHPVVKVEAAWHVDDGYIVELLYWKGCIIAY